jgi:hypothetical protein
MTLTTALVILGVVVLAALACRAGGRCAASGRASRVKGRRQHERVEPALHDTEPLAEEPPALRAATKRPPRLDALIDAIAPLALDGPITGELALQHLPSSRRAGHQGSYVEGLDTETGEWDSLARAVATANCRPACNWPTAAGR